jgi:hypothetical protein
VALGPSRSIYKLKRQQLPQTQNISALNVYSSAKDASGAGDVHAELLKRNAAVQDGDSRPSWASDGALDVGPIVWFLATDYICAAAKPQVAALTARGTGGG